jgi:photosystem II stability/assembly factor-like uncharacterized protein
MFNELMGLSAENKSHFLLRFFLQTLFFFLLVTQICFAQWEWQNPLPQINTLNEVSFFDELNGIAVGNEGSIIRTTDGGNIWAVVKSGTTNQLNAVCYLDQNTCIAVGESGLILKSTDSGLLWKTQNCNLTDEINAITFVDDKNGWLVCKEKIFKTSDSGENWSELTTGLPPNWTTLTGICFVSVDTGWAVGTYYDGSGLFAKVVKTTNGGNSWNEQTSWAPATTELKDVFFTDKRHGWIVGYSIVHIPGEWYNDWRGIVFRTEDGGILWSYEIRYDSRGLNTVHFINSTTGWIAGGDYYDSIILKTTNGGYNWKSQVSETGEGLNNIFFVNDSKGWIVGNNGTLIKTENGGSLWKSQVKGTTKNLNDVTFLNNNNGLAVGDNGTIVITTNGGANWDFQTSGITNNLKAVHFIDEQNGWSVGGEFGSSGDSSVIIHTTDGSISWTEQTRVPSCSLKDVFFIDANMGFAGGEASDSVGWYSIFLKTTDGGITWVPKYDTLGFISRIHFVDSNTGWILGSMGGMWGYDSYIYRTSDGGITWTRKLENHGGGPRGGGNPAVFDIYFRDSNNGIAIGDVVYRTTNGGDTWIDTIPLPEVSLGKIFVYENQIIGVGYGGIVCQSTDWGTSWTSQNSGTARSLNGVYFTDSNNGWAVGESGTILHTTNGGIVPVELNSFTAAANGKEVTLSWSTATELNNQGFEVQRKFGSNDFVTVGSVKGHGTTTSPNNYTYVDKLIDAGKYFYRLKQIDYGGKYEYSQVVEVNWSPFTTYKLEQNYPNPFNPTTTIGFGIPEKVNVKLSVLNILGEEIKILLNEEKEAGYHSIDFNASDLPSGVYFYKLVTGSYSSTKKMILLR